MIRLKTTEVFVSVTAQKRCVWSCRQDKEDKDRARHVLELAEAGYNIDAAHVHHGRRMQTEEDFPRLWTNRQRWRAGRLGAVRLVEGLGATIFRDGECGLLTSRVRQDHRNRPIARWRSYA